MRGVLTVTEGKDFVAYYRVSTQRQGRSGLGLSAQRRAVETYVNQQGGVLLGSFKEVESGKRDQRPMLKEALRECKRRKATLVIAKLDRLSRRASFLLSLRDSKVDFVCCDMPDMNRHMIGFYALMVEWEREQISKRTKEALQAAKERGVKLGNPVNLEAASKRGAKANKARADQFAANILPIINEIKAAGVTSVRGITQALNARGVKSARGGEWHPTAVQRLLQRAGQ